MYFSDLLGEICRKEEHSSTCCESLRKAIKSRSNPLNYPLNCDLQLSNMDIASLNRKLSVSWSAHTVSSSLSTPSAMEEVRMGFSKLEPKAKMGVLISLLNIDDVKKKDCAVAMKRLLQAASADKTNEVRTTHLTFTMPIVHLINYIKCTFFSLILSHDS